MPSLSTPVGVDLAAFLTEAGITHAFQMATLDRYAAMGVKRFEQLSNWRPFLAAASDSTREFDPPGFAGGYDGTYTRGGGRKLLLRAGLASLTSLSVSGVAKTLNTDFWLRRLNAVDEEAPYTMVEFRAPVYGEPRTIAIVGRWGYTTDLGGDVFQAMLQLAAVEAGMAAWAKRTSGIVSFSDEEVTEKFSDTPYGGVVDQWRESGEATASHYGDMSQWF